MKCYSSGSLVYSTCLKGRVVGRVEGYFGLHSPASVTPPINAAQPNSQSNATIEPLLPQQILPLRSRRGSEAGVESQRRGGWAAAGGGRGGGGRGGGGGWNWGALGLRCCKLKIFPPAGEQIFRLCWEGGTVYQDWRYWSTNTNFGQSSFTDTNDDCWRELLPFIQQKKQ